MQDDGTVGWSAGRVTEGQRMESTHENQHRRNDHFTASSHLARSD